MSLVLDRPVWSALATCHASLAEGGALARRYPASIAPFAAPADDGAASLAAFASLAGESDRVLMIEAGPIRLPPMLIATTRAMGVQMVLDRPATGVQDARIERLGDSDSAEMVALAALTRPGPFTLRARALGTFWGIREAGRLVAMAGERFHQPGHVELSGVCTHPGVQGQGLGRLLSLFVAGVIQARGEVPYLHAYEANARAIALYEALGFRMRCRMHVAAVERAATIERGKSGSTAGDGLADRGAAQASVRHER